MNSSGSERRSIARFLQTVRRLIPAYAQSVSDAINIIEPRCNERDLQDCPIVEAGGPQFVMILAVDLRRVFREPNDIIQHDALLAGNRRGFVILPQGLN